MAKISTSHDLSVMEGAFKEILAFFQYGNIKSKVSVKCDENALQEVIEYMRSMLKQRILEIETETLVSYKVEGTPICSLALSSRSANCLNRMGFKTAEELESLSKENLLGEHGFGKKSLDELRAKLQELGLHLKGEEPVAPAQ